MIDLASMIMAAFFFVHVNIGINNVPMPVVIAKGDTYSYNMIYSSINVPVDWTGTCENQKQVVFYMTEHFNAYSKAYHHKLEIQGNQKIVDKWKCVE